MYQTGYLFLALGIAAGILVAFKKFQVNTKFSWLFVLCLLLWSGYLLVMGKSGILVSMNLPPRMPLFVVIPTFLMMGWVISRPWFVELADRMPAHYLIYIQSFRIAVELVIYGTFLDGLVPERVTFEGINFDILVGITALPFGFLVQRNVLSSKAIIGWNLAGMGVLSLTVYSFISYVYFIGPDPWFSMSSFTTLPFLYLPGFLMPFAMCLHYVSIRQQMGLTKLQASG